MNRETLAPIDSKTADRFERLALYVQEALIELRRGSGVAECPSCRAKLVTGLASGVNLSELAIRCTCRQWSSFPRGSTFAPASSEKEYVPRVLFRYFDKDEYCEDFLSGRIWITTIESCRRSENADRADREEASQTFRQEAPIWNAADPAQRAVMKRLGFSAPPGSRFLLQGNSSTVYHPDEYMLCLSKSLSRRLVEQFSPNAKRVVRINKPTALFEAIGEALHARDPLFHFECAPVLYERRPIADLDPTPLYAPWLMKPKRYAHEKEIRVLWRPQMRRAALSAGFVEIENMDRYVQPVPLK